MSLIAETPSVLRAALPISVEQYHRLSQEAIIAERTELLQGIIVKQMTKSPLQTYIVQFLVRWLESVIDARHYVRKEEPLTLAESEPEPDIAVVLGSPRHYRSQHPSTAILVIEVAVATLGLDREKADIYAAAGLPECWIVAPEERFVEVYRDPGPTGYETRLHCDDAEMVLRPILLPCATIRLANIFE